MAKITHYLCDRCGNTIAGDAQYHLILGYVGQPGSEREPGVDRDLDLCGMCAGALRTFADDGTTTVVIPGPG